MSDSEEKSHEASPRKLKKQREEGNLAQTQTMTSVLTSAVGLGVMWALLPLLLSSFQQGFDTAFSSINRPFGSVYDTAIDDTLRIITRAVMPVFAFVVVAAVAATILYHKGIPFSVKPLGPKFEKLSPVAGFKRIFGRRSWIETVVGTVRIAIWFGAAYMAIWFLSDTLFTLDRCGSNCTLMLAKTMAQRLVQIAIALFVVNAGLDMLLQKSLYLHEQKMAPSEVKRESKDQHGSPEVRRERSRIRREGARSSEHAGLGKANMCFYSEEGAIAVRYHPDEAPLPRVSASARKPEGIEKIRATILGKNYPELYCPKITHACLGVAPGAPVPEPLFETLAIAMRKMFS